MRRKMKSNRQGAVLMTVTVVSVMMVVIVAAAISLVAHTNTKTNREYRKKQAYFAASSCLEAFIVKETNMVVGTYSEQFIQDRITELNKIADSDKTATVRIGELNAAGDDVIDANLIGNSHPRWNDINVTLKLERYDAGIKAISTATYLGEEQKVVAYMNIKDLQAGTTVPGALEIIGTTGGGNESYNNISVYGNTSAPDTASHDVNTVYVCNKNNNEFYGDVSIYGSLLFSRGQTTLKANPYYVDGYDNGQTKGCTLYVSRSFVMGENQPHIVSTYPKDRSYNKAPRGIDGYNYVQVGEALVMAGDNGRPNGCCIGTEGMEVDVYAGLLSMGKHAGDVTLSTGDKLIDVMKMSSTKPTEYATIMNVGGYGSGNTITGNVYLRKNTNPGSEVFDGSAYLSNDGTIFGDLYVEGDIHVDGKFTVDGNVYIQGTTGEKPEDRIDGNLTITSGHKAEIKDWTGLGGRATEPNNFNPLPYYYYPEHMLLLKDNNVSTIADTYSSFYKDDKVTLKSSPDVPVFETNSNGELYNSTGFYKTDFTDPDLNNMKFTAEARKSFILSNSNNANILVNLDEAEVNADGRHDIVIILENGAQMQNEFNIIVKNSTDPESDNARFCYIVSDAGIGIVNNEYMPNKTTPSTYSDFKPAPYFVQDHKFFVMEYESYKAAIVNNKGIDPTDNDYGADPDVFDLPHGSIIILLTEGATFGVHQESILQCSIYGPRATFEWGNNSGKGLKVYPKFGETGATIPTNVIGNCVVQNYKVSANNVTIVYNPVSSKSMVAVAHGFGQALVSSTFQLERYDNH